MGSSAFEDACLEGLDEALEAAQIAPADLPTLYELASRLGEASPFCAADDPRCVHARGLLAARPPLEVISIALEPQILAALEHALEIAEDAPGHLFAALSEVDAFACAASALGVPDTARAVIEQADLLCRLYADGAAHLVGEAQAMRVQARLDETGLRHRLWSSIIDAAAAAQLPITGQIAPSVLDAFLEQQTGGNVIIFPFSQRDAEPRIDYAMAAATDAVEADGALLAEGADGGWQLFIARPNQRLELQLFVRPECAGLSFSVSSDGVTLPVVTVAETLLAVVLDGVAPILEVQVGDERFTCRYAGTS